MKNKLQIIAEIGWNHMGDISLASQMIKSAKNAGATIVKFQFWDPSYLKKGSWDEDGRREIYNKAALSLDDIKKLQNLAEDHEVDFLISVFGTRGARIINDLGIKNIKIPSHETTNIDLINFCADNFDYVYFSAGASLQAEVMTAVEILKNGIGKFNLMHCVSSYPVPMESSNISRLDWLKNLHDDIGYSDHTQSILAPSIAIAKGARVIEKHFTINKDLPGRDNKFALDPIEFKKMSDFIIETTNCLIDKGLDYQEIEKDTVNNYRGRWEPDDYK
ncbi:N-acetylneuraminate synthase family protein [Gammaproteobacteria bacterium]|nr:N-acetylneuraminate synthase family protein [Gammaproteobacteria bacterium]